MIPPKFARGPRKVFSPAADAPIFTGRIALFGIPLTGLI